MARLAGALIVPTELTTDTFFPVAYTLFLALSTSWLYQRAFHKESVLPRVNLVPLGGWLFDLLENVGVVALLSVFPAKAPILATLTSNATGLRWPFAIFSLLFVLFGVVAYLVTRRRK